jgi:hypothetical protein
MKNPITYADWTQLFERFGNGDDSVFEEMPFGSFELDAGTAQRFYIKAEEAYKKRKQNWLEKFQRSFQIQNIKSADGFGAILLIGKRNLAPLIKFSDSKGLPEDLKTVLKKDLVDFVAEIKKSLKENLPKDDHNNEKMIITINSFSLNEASQNPFIDEVQNPNSSTGRQIIF